MLALSILASLIGLVSASPSPVTPARGFVDVFDRSLQISSGCSTTGAASCHNTSSASNLCCFESPGGLLLQTQFWDTNPTTGPVDSWTIHGLWPDHCDGSFDQSCDSSRAYTNIPSILQANGGADTLAFMQTHWVDINGNDETFWEHEWSTHGTCMSTFKVACLLSGSPAKAEAAAYFQTVVKLFKTLPTYTWLQNQGISPSTTTKYTLTTLVNALAAEAGVKPALGCSGSVLNAISWYFNLKGSGIDGVFVPIDAPFAGSCPSSGISYPPKAGGGDGGGGDGGLPAKATIHALRSGSSVGGLLSLGTWSTQTLATYTISGTASSFTMTSSKGNCGVSGGTFACGSGVSLTSFSAVTSGSTLLLASGGSTAFTSDGVPSGTTVFTVFTGSGHAQDYTLSIVST